MELLGGRVGHEGVVVRADLAEVVFQRGQVANRRVEPDIEILARCVRDFDPEIRRVAADVPVAHLGFAVGAGLDPLADFVEHLGLHRAALRPLLQKRQTARVGQLEEEMLRAFEHRLGARQRRIGVDEFGGAVNLATDLAVVAVLVFGVAVGALAFDEAVRQEHVFLGVEKLLDAAGGDQVVGLQRAVDVLRELVVFGRVGAVPVVKRDVKTVQVRLAASGDVGHELLWRFAGFFGRDHDRRAVGVVGADEMHLVAAHALKPHPNIGLDVLHDVANVKMAVGIRQGGGDEQASRLAHGMALKRG